MTDERIVVELDRCRWFVRAINHARHTSASAQAAARTRALLCAGKCSYFDFHFTLQLSGVRDQTTPLLRTNDLLLNGRPETGVCREGCIQSSSVTHVLTWEVR